MGARGPAPTPTQILKLRGSWRGRVRTSEPKAPRDEPGRPEWLDKEGKAEWNRITAILRGMEILSSADRAILAGLCQNWSLFVKTSRAVNETSDPAALNDLRGLIAVADQAYKNYASACQQFGLSPASRSRVKADKPAETKTPAAKYFA